MRILVLAVTSCFLAACAGGDAATGPAGGQTGADIGTADSSQIGFWWPLDQINFGNSDEDIAIDDSMQLGVNAYLWRATLDTLNFMPLASFDSAGGIITTDWYSPPQSPDERLKVTAYILDTRLRADAIRVAVFRQTRTPAGWADAQTNPDMATRLENAILTRAREIHLSIVEE